MQCNAKAETKSGILRPSSMDNASRLQRSLGMGLGSYVENQRKGLFLKLWPLRDALNPDKPP